MMMMMKMTSTLAKPIAKQPHSNSTHYSVAEKSHTVRWPGSGSKRPGMEISFTARDMRIFFPF